MSTGQAEVNRKSYWLEMSKIQGPTDFHSKLLCRVFLKLKTAAVSSFIYLLIY